jgi:hypothetical protein
MAKLTLSDLASLSNTQTAITTINNNSQATEDALENTLSRDGTSPNTMEADLDMNSNRILNLPEAVDDTEPVRLGDIEDLIEEFGVGPTGPAGADGADGLSGTDFLALSDTPDAYTGEAGSLVVVNLAEDGLEFTTAVSTARGSTLTIASGAITVTDSFHYVATEAAAAFDELATINGGVDGQQITLSIATAGKRVWLSNAGNLKLGNLQGSGTPGSGFLIWAKTSTISLIYDATQALWLETSRFEGRAYNGVKNVKDYGAVGDGTNDDTAAIQAAILDDDVGFNGIYQSNLTAGTILFPAGTYKITSTIDVDSTPSSKFLGEANALLTATFDGYIFDVDGGFNPSGHSFENLRFSNSNSTNVTSGCIKINGTIGVSIKDCVFGLTGGIGVNTDAAQCVTVYNCQFTGTGTGSGSIGFNAGNAGASINCDYTDLGVAIRHHNVCLTVLGGRFEVNGAGIQLGIDESGSNASSSGVVISGCSMESNNIHIEIFTATGVKIEGVNASSFLGPNTHGLLVYNGSNIYINSSGFAGSAPSVGSIVFLSDGDNDVFNVVCTNVSGIAAGWVVPNAIDTTSWVNTDYTAAFTNKYNLYTSVNVPPTTPVIFVDDATIASGAITVTSNFMAIDTEAAAASDDLDTINGAGPGQIGSRLILRPFSGSRTVVVKNGTGNIHLSGGDCTLDDIDDTLSLIWNDTSATTTPAGFWLETGRSSSAAAALQGLQTIWIPASAMTPRTTNGAAATSREINSITLGLLAFDQTTSEGANFPITFPKSWDAGTITFRPHWTCASGTGTVSWTLNGGSFADNVAINVTGIGTGITVTDTLQNVDRVHNGGTSSAVTLSNAAVDVPTFFQIVRTISDTLDADAELIGIEIFYTTNAGNDA